MVYMLGIFGREITIHTVIYGVYIRIWPTLHACCQVELEEQQRKHDAEGLVSLIVAEASERCGCHSVLKDV